MAIIRGKRSDDTLIGTDNADEIYGLAGDDEIFGEGGNDYIKGGGGHDAIYGGAGDDRLFGDDGNDVLSDAGGGRDNLNGGRGNDTLLISDLDFQAADGAAGDDRLVLNATGLVFDVTTIADNRLRGLEGIDLNGGGNELVIGSQELLTLSNTSDQLIVYGSAADQVTSGESWTAAGTETIGGQSFDKFTAGGATLLVQQGVAFDFGQQPSQPQPPSSFNELDGANGFVLNGIDAGDRSGTSAFGITHGSFGPDSVGDGAVSAAGDVNGDGYEDLIIGAPFADPNGEDSGESYVVFGGPGGFGASLELASLNGSNGFILNGEPHDPLNTGAPGFSGLPVSSAGDINGDGFADVAIAARRADPNDHGAIYVVFGDGDGFAPTLELSNLDGTNGFRTLGSNDDWDANFSLSSAGDINGDGFDDLIIGDPDAHEFGQVYVIFGRESFSPTFELPSVTNGDLDGIQGFVIDPPDNGASGGTGWTVSAGDVNGDGFDDLLIAARTLFNYDGEPSGTHVVFGGAEPFDPTFELSSLDGSNGFTIVGAGPAVGGMGDVNGDGINDLILGAASASYVVFGRTDGFGSSFNVADLDGANGFAINGAGDAVSMAGDVNGDGFDDLIIGDPEIDSGGEGAAYVVYGRAGGFPASLDLASLDPDEGFAIAGIDAGDEAGRSVSGAGDLNGDGFDDLLVGAPGGDPNGDSEAGESYVVFGGDFTGAVTHPGAEGNDTLVGDAAANVMVGGRGDDLLLGNGGLDVLIGGEGDDILAITDAVLQRLDGGTGTDTLRLDGGGIALDLTDILDPEIQDIEQIDLGGSGDNSLTLDAQDVLNLSGTSNTLTVLGNAGDTLTAIGDWGPGVDNGDFTLYSAGSALLSVDDDIAVTIAIA